MPAPNRHTDPVLARVASEMERLYGPRLRGLLLFGSRARGDHRPDSDYDVIVLVNGLADRWQEVLKLAKLSAQLDFEMGADISLRPYAPDHVAERTAFMHSVRREAVPV